MAVRSQRRAHLTAEADEMEARRTTGFDGSSLNEKLADLYVRHEELLKEPSDGPELTQEVDAQIQAAAQALEQIRAREYQSQYTKQLASNSSRSWELRALMIFSWGTSGRYRSNRSRPLLPSTSIKQRL